MDYSRKIQEEYNPKNYELAICIDPNCNCHTSQARNEYVRWFFNDLKCGGSEWREEQSSNDDGGSEKWMASLIDKVQQASGKVFDEMKADYLFHSKIVDEFSIMARNEIMQIKANNPSLTLDKAMKLFNTKKWNWVGGVKQQKHVTISKGYHLRPLPKNFIKEIENCITCKLNQQERDTHGGDYITNDKRIVSVEHILDMHPEIFLYFGKGTDIDVRPVIAFLDSIDYDKTKLGKKEKRRKIKEEKQQRILNKVPRLPKHNKNSLSRPRRTQAEIKNKIKSLDAVNQEPKLKTTEITTYERPGSIIKQLKTLHKKCMICQVEHFTKADGEQYSEVCHIIPHHTSQNNNSDNLIVLCPTCHKKFDLGRLADRKIMYEQLKMNYPAESFTVPIWYDEVEG